MTKKRELKLLDSYPNLGSVGTSDARRETLHPSASGPPTDPDIIFLVVHERRVKRKVEMPVDPEKSVS